MRVILLYVAPLAPKSSGTSDNTCICTHTPAVYRFQSAFECLSTTVYYTTYKCILLLCVCWPRCLINKLMAAGWCVYYYYYYNIPTVPNVRAFVCSCKSSSRPALFRRPCVSSVHVRTTLTKHTTQFILARTYTG